MAQTTLWWPRKEMIRHGVQMSPGLFGSLLGCAESLWDMRTGKSIACLLLRVPSYVTCRPHCLF